MFSDATLSYDYDDLSIGSDASGNTLASTLRHGSEYYRPEASAAPVENEVDGFCHDSHVSDGDAHVSDGGLGQVLIIQEALNMLSLQHDRSVYDSICENSECCQVPRVAPDWNDDYKESFMTIHLFVGSSS